jgi:hypothetical protein
MITASSKNSFIKTPFSSVSASSVLLAIVFVALIRRPNKFSGQYCYFFWPTLNVSLMITTRSSVADWSKHFRQTFAMEAALNKSPQFDGEKCSHP